MIFEALNLSFALPAVVRASLYFVALSYIAACLVDAPRIKNELKRRGRTIPRSSHICRRVYVSIPGLFSPRLPEHRALLHEGGRAPQPRAHAQSNTPSLCRRKRVPWRTAAVASLLTCVRARGRV